MALHSALLRRTVSTQRGDRPRRRRIKNTEHTGNVHRVLGLETCRAGIDIPVLNMFDAVARHCRLEGHREVLILGTALTMRCQVLRDTFTTQDIEASAPVDSDHREAVLSLISKLQLGDSKGAAQSIEVLVHEVRLRQFAHPPAVCLACTELPLAFPAHHDCAAFETVTAFGMSIRPSFTSKVRFRLRFPIADCQRITGSAVDDRMTAQRLQLSENTCFPTGSWGPSKSGLRRAKQCTENPVALANHTEILIQGFSVYAPRLHARLVRVGSTDHGSAARRPVGTPGHSCKKCS